MKNAAVAAAAAAAAVELHRRNMPSEKQEKSACKTIIEGHYSKDSYMFIVLALPTRLFQTHL